MKNVKPILNRHNKKVLCKKKNHKKDQDRNICNCRSQDSCPINNKCLHENLIYKTTITIQNEVKEYIGSTGGPFKKR